MTFVKADKLCIKYLGYLQELSSSNSTAKILHDSLLEKLEKDRRNVELFGLMRYLETGQNYETVTKKSPLQYPKKKDLAKIAATHYARLFPAETAQDEDERSVISSTGSDEPKPKKSRLEEVREMLEEDEMKHNLVTDTLGLMRKEMALFELNPDNHQPMLMKLRDALMSGVPTSVEPERSFSAAGQFVTKFRTSLKDDILDTMILVRSFLKGAGLDKIV